MEIQVDYSAKKIIYLVKIGFDPELPFESQLELLTESFNQIKRQGLTTSSINRSGNYLRAERSMNDFELNLLDNYLMYVAHNSINKSRDAAIRRYEKAKNLNIEPKGLKNIEDKYNKQISKINYVLSNKEKMIHQAVSNVKNPLALEVLLLSAEEAKLCVDEHYREKKDN